MFRIIRQKHLDYLENANQRFKMLCIENNDLKKDINLKENLMSNLKEKLNGTKAIVYSIRSDKHGNDTFICVQDNRKFNISFLRFEGSLNIFILSSIIAPQHRPEKYKDMPYLESRFVGEKIELYELHSDIIEEEYENRGYATMMLDTLLEIARKSNCTLITGHLTQEDAKTEKQKNKRNNFYKNYKTAKVELTFENDLE